MYNIVISDKERVLQAIEEGKTLALFAVDGDGRPLQALSPIKCFFDRTPNKVNKYVEKAMEYIEENYYKDIRSEDLARFCDVSVSHLSRLFSAATGSTVTEYILAYRMNRAAYLLVNTDESVVNIAREVGMEDCGYFHKRFRSYFGVTPLGYRKNITLK